MSSRTAILDRIRRSLSAPAADDVRQNAVSDRIALHLPGAVPTITSGKAVKQFADKVLAAAASVETIARDDIAKSVTKFLRQHNLPQRLRMGADKRLKQIDWPKTGGPEIVSGPSDGKDLAGLSHAFAGAAETGTLILLSGQDNPTTVNFLPENHIVIVEAADVADNFEAIWTRLRKKTAKAGMPRTVNMITGPSRSADIEQTLIMGAHGPVRLHVIIVKD